MVNAAPPKPAPKYRYQITDPNCRNMSGQAVAPGQQYIYLTEAQAAYFLANGSLIPAPQ